VPGDPGVLRHRHLVSSIAQNLYGICAYRSRTINQKPPRGIGVAHPMRDGDQSRAAADLRRRERDRKRTHRRGKSLDHRPR